MEAQGNLQKRTLTAIAIILAKSKLSYNKNGQEQVKLKLILGQKSSLVIDNHPFSIPEVIQATATNAAALLIDSLNTATEIQLTAMFISGLKHPYLKITQVKPV
ncbi:MAG: hypothetical protein HON55_04900 [Legionellales bacterium]|jgi:hypothetical protein|nr:hypothetical protein [Legionellales bacterium]